ncbi:hypothetical protein BKA62DRAFT_282495 [Auriculariales sp. MPI-PUGE-AT-0066]|nr:hypothetical protein BKA62DRAFT_282495 [Auriculariales sp. MPI-PUGE-AT-0066]
MGYRGVQVRRGSCWKGEEDKEQSGEQTGDPGGTPIFVSVFVGPTRNPARLFRSRVSTPPQSQSGHLLKLMPPLLPARTIAHNAHSFFIIRQEIETKKTGTSNYNVERCHPGQWPASGTRVLSRIDRSHAAQKGTFGGKMGCAIAGASGVARCNGGACAPNPSGVHGVKPVQGLEQHLVSRDAIETSCRSIIVCGRQTQRKRYGYECGARTNEKTDARVTFERVSRRHNAADESQRTHRIPSNEESRSRRGRQAGRQAGK